MSDNSRADAARHRTAPGLLLATEAPSKLAENPVLRAVVEEKLGEWWSPQQVVLWLKRTYPDNQEMRVSHETIYLSLFIQGKGALRRELTECLRTGRAYLRPKTKRAPSGKDKITNPVMISERPAEVAGRVVSITRSNLRRLEGTMPPSITITRTA